MALEIERKFLVRNLSGIRGVRGVSITQGYLSDQSPTVRVRVAGDQGFLTIKGKARGARGISRPEYEYEIPLDDALEMLAMCADRIVQKIRFEVKVAGVIFEVDQFQGRHAGLVMAEVELEHEDQEIPTPAWLGIEVSADKRFSNKSLAISGRTPLRLAA